MINLNFIHAHVGFFRPSLLLKKTKNLSNNLMSDAVVPKKLSSCPNNNNNNLLLVKSEWEFQSVMGLWQQIKVSWRVS